LLVVAKPNIGETVVIAFAVVLAVDEYHFFFA
jgi:hypothetical protein